MRKIIFVYIIFGFFVLPASAQGKLLATQLAELKTKAETLAKEGQVKAYVDTLNRISYLYFKENPDSSWAYATKAYNISAKENYQAGLARAKINFSGNYYYQKDYGKTFNELIEAYQIAVKISDQKLIATCLNNIGLAYLQQKDYNNALKHFQHSLELSSRLKENDTQMLNHFNIGFCNAILFGRFKKSDNFLEALKHYQIAQGIAKNIKNQTYFYTCYHRLGDLFVLKKDYNTGIGYFEKMLADKEEISDWELGATYASLAKANIGLKKYDRAIKFAEQAFGIAKKDKDAINIDKSLTVLAEVYKVKGDFKKAYEILAEKVRYAELASDEESKKRVNGLLIKQKNIENQYLTKELDAQKKNSRLNLLLVIASVFFLLVVTTLFIIVYRKSKQKSKLNRLLADNNVEIVQQKDLIAQQNIELHNNDEYKNKLLSVIGHDLRSPFATTLQAIKFFKEGDLSKEEMNMFIDDFHEKILDCLSLLDDLLIWTKNNRSIETHKIPIRLTGVSERVAKELAHTISLKQIYFTHYVTPINDKVLIDEKQVMVILRNLVTNAIKFTRPKGTIEIFYSEEPEEGQVLLHIKDNGIGMNVTKAAKLFAVFGDEVSSTGTAGESGSGIGLSLVSDFAKLNGIKVQFRTQENNGTEFILQFNQLQG